MVSKSGILKYYLELSKLKIMIPVAFTGFTGYFIFNPSFSLKLFAVSTGILLLAISASVLNQIQEADRDSKMERTKYRPLPSGNISLKSAVTYFLICFLSGLFLVWYYGNQGAFLTGILTLFWYNGLYTFAKRITAFAVVPGAVTGALPPVIGWVAPGGSPWDKTIILIAFLFFIGQVPHFWLIMLRYGEQYSNAGFPSLTQIMSRSAIRRLIFIWVFVSALAAVFLCTFEIIRSGVVVAILLIASIVFVWQFRGLAKPDEDQKYDSRLPLMLNIYFLLVMVLLILDKFYSN